MSQYLRPRFAVVDPKLTLSCPRKVTADSGIDALTHAIEAYTAVDNADFPLPPGETSLYQGRHPLGDCLAEKAISLIGANLPRAVEQPNDLAAREAMSLGAMLAGLAFSNVGVAMVHALEYPIGAATHCSHGAGNGLLLPYVMRYNLVGRERQFARIAELLGQDVSGVSEKEAALARGHRSRAAESHDRYSRPPAGAGREAGADSRVCREGAGHHADRAGQSAGAECGGDGGVVERGVLKDVETKWRCRRGTVPFFSPGIEILGQSPALKRNSFDEKAAQSP